MSIEYYIVIKININNFLNFNWIFKFQGMQFRPLSDAHISQLHCRGFFQSISRKTS